MSRIRSPGYPFFPLHEVVDFAAKIHARDRQYAVAREVACQHMGFAGASGTSDRAISALFHYGLAEKVVKGEIRITDLAVRIIHSDDMREKREALHEAGFSPDLFRELRDKYPGSPPSISTLNSHLSRQGFAPVAIPPAARAYAATCEYLQRENAYESGSVQAPVEAPPAPSIDRREEPSPVSTQIVPTTPPPATPPAVVFAPALADLELNEPNLSIRGNTVRIEALLDFDGLSELEGKIAALKMLMKPARKATAVTIAPPPPSAPPRLPELDEDEPDWNSRP